MPNEPDETIREILRLHARLFVEVGTLRDRDDLFNAGMNSHANVSVMLALEEEFGVEFPDHMMVRATFESLYSIRQAISELLEEEGADR
jgi:acyl carrier protein